MTLGYNKMVHERDAKGRRVWSYGARWPWTAQKLANGNVLVSDYGGGDRGVVEVSPSGKVVWQFRAQANSAKELADGSILIAEGFGNRRAGHRILEVDKVSKKVIWEHKTPRPCTDVQGLPNGNILVASMEHVFEITREHKIVWKFAPRPTALRGVQRLRNGNTLVADFSGRAVEISPDGKVVWQFDSGPCTDAFRLPNGNTLVTGSSFMEVTPDKRVLWKKPSYNFGVVRKRVSPARY
jgi:hypothetical protein